MSDPIRLGKEIIESEIKSLRAGSMETKDGCVACHMIFTMVKKLGTNEQDAADLLSQVLTNYPKLNDEFIDVVESIHMGLRTKAMNFYKRDRDSKDRYIESYFKNALTELQSDSTRHGADMALRKVVLNYLSSYLAQTLGIDFHASTEELYYILRKHEDFDNYLQDFLQKFVKELKPN
jgi:cytochrome c